MRDMKQMPLSNDVRLLGDLLGVTVKEQAGDDIYTIIEQIRKLAKSNDNVQLTALLKQLPVEQLLPVTKAFSQFLNFSNIAEQYNRIRRSRQYQAQPGSLDAEIPKLKDKGIAADQIYSAICALQIQFVLTSHPTEVKRRTVMRKYDRISTALQKLDKQSLTAAEIAQVKNNIHSEMTAVWQTPEVRSHKPTPVDEAKWGFAIIEGSLWHAVPMFMRELDRVVATELGENLPLSLAPIKIDSWLGGDRDGNPNVTPEVTRRVAFMARWVAADLLLKEIYRLRDILSMQTCNAKLRQLVGAESTEPYRDLLQQVQQKLKNTKHWARDNFTQACNPTKPIFYSVEELLALLMICYDSLVECKAKIIADGKLLDIIRQLYCFGLSLVRMDIRQEASKHADIVSTITINNNLGKYADWSELDRQEFLITQLQEPRRLITNNLNIDQTFNLLAELPRDGLGGYVISMASNPSDVLAVAWLQQQFGISQLLPVVPLFETYNDLLNSAQILDKLFSCDAYRKLINNSQQVMIGYSDSAKDVGFLAAAWAQYRAQEAMLAVAKHYGVTIVFFHGRGGSLGRGGWPTYESIMSQPPGSVHGIMRVTQQGEVIQNRFGLRAIALRTFSVYTTATLQASLLPPSNPKIEWRELLDELTRISAASYKKTVAEDARFLDYFKAATPTRELKKLAIGSRPDSRTNTDNISKLRAIPWVFAWTQNRLLLPSWVGVGEALGYAFEIGRGEDLIRMSQQWPFMHTVLSMCEMILAKADIQIAQLYEARLVPVELFPLGDSLRQQFLFTKQIILRVLEQDNVLANNDTLSRSIKLRTPYLLALHLLQIELLSRVRIGEENSSDGVIQALLISIAGIAAGMRNTG